MDIPISDALEAWIESQVEAGPYATAGASVADPIRRGRRAQEDPEALAAALAAGDEGGIGPRRVPDIVAALISAVVSADALSPGHAA